ncbi:MAG: hypothetical protein GKR96_14355 [Gammaproteobacteria bacterium]|nr:hypothetical protein [Gammaproteobacteria bacterium]
MRYQEGEIPPELLAANSSNEMLLFTAIMGFVIGILFVYLGRTGKQLWMWTWGAGLVLCSLYLWFAIKNDIRVVDYLS